LCTLLGDRLEAAGDDESASNCYMCALHLDGAVQYWIKQLETANENAESEHDLIALHDFVVQVSVLSKVTGVRRRFPKRSQVSFTSMRMPWRTKGIFATAAKYSQNIPDSPASLILRDRLYRGRASPRCLAVMGGGAPDYPYTLVTINPSAGQTLASEEREREQAYQQQQQQAQYDQQQQQQAQQQYGQQQAQQQDQQYGQAQQQYGQQQTTQAQYGQQQAATDQLPAGWIALQDPLSGQTYYANQTTGETSWERPAASVLPQQPTSAGVSGDASYASNGGNTGTPSSKAHNMTEYGDGFVTSAAHPELASQYDNHGTSNPYHGAERPGTAAAVVGG
jgi:protein transport protein SEC31